MGESDVGEVIGLVGTVGGVVGDTVGGTPGKVTELTVVVVEVEG
jgi:hypothetical protein